MLNPCAHAVERSQSWAPFAPEHGEDFAQQLVLFEVQPVGELDADDPEASRSAEWTEEDVVLLHWRLLQELRHLPEADTPLEEKIDALNWVFTDPDRESAPFSFVRCVQVVSTSPLSPTPYFGRVDPDEIKDWIRANVRRWMGATLERYPPWVRDVVRADPARVVRQLDRNPQWINEEVKKRKEFGDFFA
ncbi:MAG TPA: hypothetical protein VFR86_26995 [Burkholderiaceae bacterium]|nr:hypothetical protein [Burkholderiaceae bacterium]